MSTTWEVRFCERCFRAFDVEDTRRCLPEVCDECKHESRRGQNRRQYEKRRLQVRNRMTIPPDPWMVKRRQEGALFSEIAREAGCSKTTILRRFKRCV